MPRFYLEACRPGKRAGMSSFEHQAFRTRPQIRQGSVDRIYEGRWAADVETLREITDHFFQERTIDAPVFITRRRGTGTGQDAALTQHMEQFPFADYVAWGLVGKDQGLPVQRPHVRQIALVGVFWCVVCFVGVVFVWFFVVVRV